MGDRMRNQLIGSIGALMLVATMIAAGCGSNSSNTGTGGAGGTGGNVSTGGAGGTGGNVSTGGAGGTGGSASTGGQSGGGASGETSVTILGGTATLGSLTAVDATQLCKDTYAYFAKVIAMATACKYKGLSYATSSSAPSDAQFRQVCTDHESTCLQAGSGVGSVDNPGCSALPPTCVATVTQYSACIRDEVAAFNQGMSGLPSCAAAASANISAVWEVMVPEPPASCQSLTDKCPALSLPAPNN
jgi:hypothetical protein